MALWAAYHHYYNVNAVGKKKEAEEKREEKGEGELYFSTVFLNCIS